MTDSPILLAHAQNDWTIPVQHAQKLYRSLVASRGHQAAPLSTFELAGWGRVTLSGMHGAVAAGTADETGSGPLQAIRGKKKGAEVIFWEGVRGGHNDLGWTEAGIDLIARISGL